MHAVSVPLAGFACLLLCACGGASGQQAQAPMQQAQAPSAGSCDDFARSGGYPYLSGGRMGGNPNILQLPGARPLIFGPGDTDLERHLEEQDYLRNWCLQNQDKL